MEADIKALEGASASKKIADAITKMQADRAAIITAFDSE